MTENEVPQILIVDDAPRNLRVLTQVLDDEGFELLFARDGKTALERIGYTKPDLILLDVMMPVMDGFEMCKKLKEDPGTKDIPVIFMTALSSIDDKIKAFRLGAVDYITKPIQADEVLARVHTHLKLQSLQDSLKQKNDELQKALMREKEHNELKSRFISIAAHDLRTPLAAINTIADLLIRYSNRLSEEKKMFQLDRIKAAVKQGVQLLDEVMIISKAEADKLELEIGPIQLRDFCQKIVDETRTFTQDTHTINFSIEGECPYFMADEKLLWHILSNLLSNAVKYSPAGGVIEFKVFCEDSQAVFEIRDNGIGIPKADQEKMFRAFHRAANVGDIKGTGLGLSIVKQFVQLHKGTVSFESEENKGATFIVKLPKLIHSSEELKK